MIGPLADDELEWTPGQVELIKKLSQGGSGPNHVEPLEPVELDWLAINREFSA